MRRLAPLAALALFLTLLSPAVCSADEPGSMTLVEDPAEWDGRTIQFTGEAIAEVMRRGSHSWLHLNDDAYAERTAEEGAELTGFNSGLGIWIPAELADRVKRFGNYTMRGDLVRVSGTFNAACAAHGGDMDLHADTLEVVAAGEPVPSLIIPWKLPVVALLTLLVIALAAADRWVGARERSGHGARGRGRA